MTQTDRTGTRLNLDDISTPPGSQIDVEKSCPAVSPLWLLPVLILATAIRLYGLGRSDLWGDEAFSVVTSLGSSPKLIGLLSASEPHPPLYPLMLAVWLRVAGADALVARIPSAFAGIASVAVVASLARSFAPRGSRRLAALAAVVAGLLVAVNPFQVWYSQEARMYAQLSFFTGLSTIGLLRIRRGQRLATPLYTLAILGGVATHYYGAFIPLCHGIAVLAFVRRDRIFLIRWAKSTGLAVLLFAPWVYYAERIFGGFLASSPGDDLVDVVVSSWARVAAGWSLDYSEAVSFASYLTVAAIVGIALPPRSRSDSLLRIVLASWAVVPFVAAYLISLVHPLFNERYLIVSSIPFILLIARAITWLIASAFVFARSRAWARLLGGAATLIGLASLAGVLMVCHVPLANLRSGAYVKSLYSAHTTTIDAIAADGDSVILNGPTQEYLYQYYVRQPLPHFTLPRQTPLDVEATEAELASIALQHQGGWAIWYANEPYDPTNVVGRWLGRNAYLSLDKFAGNARLQYYRFARNEELARHDALLSFGDSLVMTEYLWSGDPVRAGDTVAVQLKLKSPTGAPGDPRVSLRLVDDQGFIWGQSDQSVGNGFLKKEDWVGGETVDDRHGIRIPTGTPPGDYALHLNVYDGGEGGALDASGTGASVRPGGVELAMIHVVEPSRSIWLDDVAGYRPVSAAFGDGLTLLGYAGSERVIAGESGYLTIVWQTSQPSIGPTGLLIGLVGGDASVVQDRILPIASSSYPIDRWQDGEVIREQYRLPVRQDIQPGDYQLVVEPVGSTIVARRAIQLGLLHVDAGLPVTPVELPQRSLEALFDGKAALMGFDLDKTVARGGDSLNLTLHWRDEAPLAADYTVFVHVLDRNEKVVAQHDQQPVDGARPTSSWFPGDAILDPYTLTLPAELAPGDYTIEMGLYHPTTGERLPVTLDGQPSGDRVIIAHIGVVK